MKNLRIFIFMSLCGFLLSTTSCKMHRHHRHGHDNGKHKGWYKNPNNPHHPASTNPGKANQKSKGNSNGNGKGAPKKK